MESVPQEYSRRFMYLKEVENRLPVQTRQNTVSRIILTEWLAEVNDYCKKTRTHGKDVLHMCVVLLDRITFLKTIPLEKLQAYGIVCYAISSKYHEIYIPDYYVCNELTKDSYKIMELVEMEEEILKLIGYNCTTVTIRDFYTLYLAVLNMLTDEHLSKVDFLGTVCLLTDPSTIVPSLAAAACLMTYFTAIGSNDPWPEVLISLTGIPLNQKLCDLSFHLNCTVVQPEKLFKKVPTIVFNEDDQNWFFLIEGLTNPKHGCRGRVLSRVDPDKIQ